MDETTPPPNLPAELRSLPPGSAMVVKLGSVNYADNYFGTLSAILRDYVMEVKGYTVYVSVTNPVSLLIDILSSIDVPTVNVSFLDVTSYMMIAKGKRAENTTYVESPTMLETIMLRVEYLLKKSPKEKKIVVIDSISSLAIHNNKAILSEFIHILVNTLKSRGAITILLTVAEETTPELENIVSLVCDRTVNLAGGGAK